MRKQTSQTHLLFLLCVTGKRISIVSGASVIVLAVVFWVLFGDEITTDDAQVDGYITTVSPRVSGDVVSYGSTTIWRYTQATRSLTLMLVIIKPLTTKRRLRTMWAVAESAIRESQHLTDPRYHSFNNGKARPMRALSLKLI